MRIGDNPNVTVSQLARAREDLNHRRNAQQENRRVLGPSGLQQPSESTVNTNPQGRVRDA